MASVPTRPSPQPLTPAHDTPSAEPGPMEVESPMMLSPEMSPPTSPSGGRSSFRRNYFSDNIVRRLRSRSPNPRAATMDEGGVGARHAHEPGMEPPAASMVGPDRAVQSPGVMSPPPVSGTFPPSQRAGHARDGSMARATRSVSTPALAPSSTTTTSTSTAALPKEHKSSRHSGTFTDCGRHSNEWLFGGFSIRETAGRAVAHLTQGERRNS